MKIITIIASLLLMVGCVHSSGKSSSVNIDGTWKGEMEGGMGGMPMKFTFNFKKIGDSVKGSVNGSPGIWMPLEDLEIKGNKISFSVISEMYGMKSIMKYKGKIKGEKIELSFKTKTPGGRGPRPNLSMGGMGGMGGGMGGMGGGMGAPKSKNEFTVERVAWTIEGPVN